MQIMSVEKKYFPLFIFFATIILFLITRLINLTILPIFTDEAVYIRWAKMINEDLHNIWLPIQSGNKKPLLMWLIAVSLNIFQDPLWAARVISVLAGFFSLIGIYFIGIRLHSVWVGSLSALFYTISPYHLFYDRMAHQAGLLNCFFIWLVLLTLVILQQEGKSRGIYYWALGLIIGLSLLTKVTALLFAFLPLVVKLVFFRKNTFAPWKLLSSSYLFGLLIAGFPYGFLFLTFSKFSEKISFFPTGNTLREADITDILLQIPHNISNLGGSISYFIVYLTLPVFLLALAFFIFQFKTFNKKNIL